MIHKRFVSVKVDIMVDAVVELYQQLHDITLGLIDKCSQISHFILKERTKKSCLHHIAVLET